MPPLLYVGGQLVPLVQHFPPSVRPASVQCDRHGRHTAYALCSLHFAASFMQPFFKTTINFTFSSFFQSWLAWSSFFHFLSIVNHLVKETKLLYCYPKTTACSNHKTTNLHEVTRNSWPFVSNIWIQTSDLLHIRHMVLCFTQGGLCIGWPTALRHN